MRGQMVGSEEEKMEERGEESSAMSKYLKQKNDTTPRFLEDDRLLTSLLESTSESRLGKIRGSFGTVGGRRRRRRELVMKKRIMMIIVVMVMMVVIMTIMMMMMMKMIMMIMIMSIVIMLIDDGR